MSVKASIPIYSPFTEKAHLDIEEEKLVRTQTPIKAKTKEEKDSIATLSTKRP